MLGEHNTEIARIFSEDINEFVTQRDIKPEDYSLLADIVAATEEWGADKSNVVIRDFHNLFSLSKERSISYLRAMKNLPGRPSNWNDFIDKLIDFAGKYHYGTAHHLIRILERS